MVLGRHSNGSEKVVLLYEKTVGSRSYLYYRFLSCSGGVGSTRVLRSVGLPYFIWHVEASFNNHLNRWRIFWDEKNGSNPATNMRTKYLNWWGSHSDSAYLLSCASYISSTADPTGPAGREGGREERLAVSSPRSPSIGALTIAMDSAQLTPTAHAVAATPPTDNPSAGYAAEGCKRFFASYDGSASNGSHRHLISLYADQVLLINEAGAIVNSRAGEHGIPLTGTCNYGRCSYQEIAKYDSTWNRRLSHKRFTDYFNNCDGGEVAITPTITAPYPMAMASGGGATVVLYEELRSSTNNQLNITVIDD